MIHITFYKDSIGLLQQVEMTGHAGYDDPGYDIVCAAVSSQVISVENSLVKLLGLAVETDVDEVEGGYLKLILPQEISSDVQGQAQLLLQHLAYAYEVLQEAYPEFIHLHVKSI